MLNGKEKIKLRRERLKSQEVCSAKGRSRLEVKARRLDIIKQYVLKVGLTPSPTWDAPPMNDPNGLQSSALTCRILLHLEFPSCGVRQMSVPRPNLTQR
jgi:hypothetical protein